MFSDQRRFKEMKRKKTADKENSVTRYYFKIEQSMKVLGVAMWCVFRNECSVSLLIWEGMESTKSMPILVLASPWQKHGANAIS